MLAIKKVARMPALYVIKAYQILLKQDDLMKIKLNVILAVFIREMQEVPWCAMERCMGWCPGGKAVACQATPVSMSKCASSSIGSKMSWPQTLRVPFCFPPAFGPHHTVFWLHE